MVTIGGLAGGGGGGGGGAPWQLKVWVLEAVPAGVVAVITNTFEAVCTFCKLMFTCSEFAFQVQLANGLPLYVTLIWLCDVVPVTCATMFTLQLFPW